MQPIKKLIIVLIILVVVVLIATFSVMFNANKSSEENIFYDNFSVIQGENVPKSPSELIAMGKNSLRAQSAMSLMYPNNLNLFGCNLNNSPEIVVKMIANINSLENTNTIFSIKRALEDWEQTMAEDLAHVLYPDTRNQIVGSSPFVSESFNPDYLVVDFHRVSSVYFGSTNTYLHYAWIYGSVFFARSLNCLEMTLELVYPVH